jgi:uncharacterized protein YkwD
MGRLPVPVMSVMGSDGTLVARFIPPRPTQETVLLLAEIYRRGTGWKLRALCQGYADGLAGVARDFGVDVADDGSAGGADAKAEVDPEIEADPEAEGFVGLVNAERSRSGLPGLVLDARLVSAARAHAGAMAAQGRLGVEGPDGTSLFHRVAASGYAYLTIAEHIVSGPPTEAEFVEYCLSGERNRLPLYEAAFTHAGIGQAGSGPSGDVYWTALWARPFTAAGLAAMAAEVVVLTNAERAAARLAPLAGDRRLTAAAQAHSADMVARDFYSHTTPEGREPWDRAAAAGAAHRGIGENIACGQRTPAEVVQGWMNSPGHRANILKPEFTHIGIGYATGSRAGTYWTQLFGM